jgi:hypothetical protein
MPASRSRVAADSAAGRTGGSDLTRALAAHLRALRQLAAEAAVHRDLALAAPCAATRDAHLALAAGYLGLLAARRAGGPPTAPVPADRAGPGPVFSPSRPG